MATSKLSKRRKKELPSFLLGLTNVPENVPFSLNTSKNAPHLGPVFFGCQQYHPSPHSLRLGSYPHIQFTLSSAENILHDMLLTKPDTVKQPSKVTKSFHPVVKHQKLFSDPYPHKCPGTRKIFAPEVAFPYIDLGETKSIIEGETSREIPLYCLRRVCSSASETEFELLTLSDIREKKRIYMSYNERMAHAHFPKQFVTVRVIGPTIPVDITITKLPSKRKMKSEIDLSITSKIGNSVSKIGEISKEGEEDIESTVMEEVEQETSEVILSNEE